ncbi:MAG TPA: hypothetical protein VGP68_10430 [Gemmataceae bacterium]|jgi:hypothetical protein|nr:hypothetical protein [Gemmataceae bacterium]
MNRELLIGRILDDEGLRGDLSDDAAQPLIDWLVQQAELAISKSESQASARKLIDTLCQRGRTIAQFITQAKDDPEGAAQLAKAERLPWPLPETAEAEELMRKVLDAESS